MKGLKGKDKKIAFDAMETREPVKGLKDMIRVVDQKSFS